jgi:hypothetical protein
VAARRKTARYRCGSTSRAVSRSPFRGYYGTISLTAIPAASFTPLRSSRRKRMVWCGESHDRMPVIYDGAMGKQWLDGPFGGRAMALVLQPLLRSEWKHTKSRHLSIRRRTIRQLAFKLFQPISKVKRSCRYSSTFVSLWLDIASFAWGRLDITDGFIASSMIFRAI